MAVNVDEPRLIAVTDCVREWIAVKNIFLTMTVTACHVAVAVKLTVAVSTLPKVLRREESVSTDTVSILPTFLCAVTDADTRLEIDLRATLLIAVDTSVVAVKVLLIADLRAEDTWVIADASLLTFRLTWVEAVKLDTSAFTVFRSTVFDADILTDAVKIL